MSNSIAARSTRRTAVATRHVRRLSRLECAALAVMVVALAATATLSAPLAGQRDLPTQTHRVEPGDTLWSIAASHPVPGLDTAHTVDLISDINGLENPSLLAGSAILVPSGAPTSNVAMR